MLYVRGLTPIINSGVKPEGQEPQRNPAPRNLECSIQHSHLGPKWTRSKLAKVVGSLKIAVHTLQKLERVLYQTVYNNCRIQT
jgi:hypothetical protein